MDLLFLYEIFYPDAEIAVPWEVNETRGRGESLEEESDEGPRFCGASDCNLICKAGEWCANTGKSCQNYPCCDSVSCIKFNV